MPAPTARERILDAAERLVLSQGFSATTVDAVLAEAHASKGAFFHHFPSKAHLGRALVERYAAADVRNLELGLSRAEAVTSDPLEQLVVFLQGFEEASESLLMTQPSCLFVSFIYESELDGAGTDEVVRRAVLDWRERIAEKLRLAAESRPRLAEVDLEALADQVFTVFEGAFLLARAVGETDAMRRQLAHLRHYLELLGGAKTQDGQQRLSA